ncbi:hypothetical protein CBR_g64871 [Chara braunii]|uniref:Integrase catalytic domain-containing protein n=1 Tax=Chara braunii TaxID=69332 RepID=A0A388K965_CHABU|nr:hypothetical protein CBR_g64871 [Chara braunii]|eukprot:GBG66598.1 hypothetical protein CBR_g64871 [Chara braunii]
MATTAMSTSAQQTSQASSSGVVGSTVAQTVSQSTGIMASQATVLTPEDVAIQQAALQEAQLQRALGEIKAEKERMIRTRARMQRRGADIEELETMNLTHMDDDVKVVRRALLGVIEMQEHQTTILQDIQQSLAVLAGRAQAAPSPAGPGAWPMPYPPFFVPPVTGVSPYIAPSSVAIVSLGMPLSGGVTAGSSLQVPVQTVFTPSPSQIAVTTQPAVSQPVQPQGTQPQQLAQQPVSPGPQPGVMQGPGQTQWVPKTAIAAPKPFTADKRGEDLDTWLRAVPVYVRYGLYEFVVMPFGLCNAPGTFQHAMNRIFQDYLDKFVIVYLDDILIFSKTVEEHVAHLDKVLSLLRQHKFKINGEKCEFGRTRILYLGHEISAEGLKPDDAKVASIRDWPRPQSVTEMRSFLGMTGYYRTFVKNYSIVAAPLTDLTRLDTPWEWTDKCEAAFRHLKHALTHYEVLKLPDPDKLFIVTTDASQYTIGAVLAQQEGPKLRPVEYMSKKMPSQKSTYEKELYALYVDTCQVCQRDKPRTQTPLGLLKPLPIAERPGESLSIDFMDTLITNKSGMRHIFIIVDRFSKYARLVAMPETTRKEYVIRMFKENWVRDFGLPKSIVSDRDVRFTSELWKAVAAEQGTQLQMTSGNHPEANGQAEQLNRVVQHLLRHYIKPNQVDWDGKLALIASLYNNAVHSATGVSPNSLLLTFKPRLPLDFLLPENESTAAPGTLEFAYRYEQKMQQAVVLMQKAHAAMIESENRNRRPSTFQVGDRVWVKSSKLGQEYGISHKLMPRYFGPWEVLDIVGTDPDGPSYVIRIPGHLRTYPVFHASKLAPFKETDQFPSRRSMLPPTMDEEVDIDDIVDHRELPVSRPAGRGRPPKPKLQYRVRFRHHTDPKEDRWFTREELMQTAPQVVTQYERSLQKGKRPMIED